MADPKWDDTEELAPAWDDTDEVSKPGYLESAARGLAQGASFGFADELTAAAESAFTDKTYDQALAESRANYRAAHDANPITSTIGEIAGGIGTAIIPGVAPATLGKVVARGALEGAAYGIGSSEGESVGDIAKDALTGAAFGGAGGAVGHGLSKGITKAQQALIPAAREFAEERAVKAAGLIQKDLNKLPAGSANELGRELLDRKLIKPGRTADELLEGFEGARKQVGEELGESMKKADTATGGAGPQVRASVAGRKLEDANLREAEREAEGMALDAFQTRVANAVEKREQAIQAEQVRLLAQVDDLEGKAATEAAKREAAIKADAEYRIINRDLDSQLGATKGYEKRDALALEKAQRAAPQLTPVAADPATLAALPEGERKRLIEEHVLGRSGFKASQREKVALDVATAGMPEVKPLPGNPESLAALPPKERKAMVESYVMDLQRQRIPDVDPRSFSQGLGFDMHKFADRVQRELIPEMNDPSLQPIKKDLLKRLAAYRAEAMKGVSFSEAREMKTNIQKTISKFVDAPISQQGKLKLQAILDDEIEQGLGRVLSQADLDAYKAQKKSYGHLKIAAKAAEGAQRREIGNRFTSPSDYGVGLMAGAMTGNIGTGAVTSAGVSLVHKAVRERGSSAMAVGADRLADILQNHPARLGRFAPALSAAAARGGHALAVADHVLQSQSPEYRQQRKALDEDE